MSDLLILALKQRCYQDELGTDAETLAQQFRLHLHRGISYLAGDPNLRSIEDLCATALFRDP
jgi:DNA sulfur modification protein DndE